MRLRVMTLNVWNTEGGPRRLEMINRELQRLQPDLIAFQEVVDTPVSRTLDRLVEGLGVQATHQAEVLADAPPFSERYGGSAVATRWPHRVVEALDLRIAEAADMPWATLAAVVRLPGLGELLFIGATAAWRRSQEAARERQAVAIAELDARHRRELPTIIAGDFNATPEAGSIRYLTGLQSLAGRSVCYHDAWAVAGEGPGFTWSTENPNVRLGSGRIMGQAGYRGRFDYVFIGSWDAHPKAHARVESARLAFDQAIDGLWASDHFAVVVDLDLGRND